MDLDFVFIIVLSVIVTMVLLFLVQLSCVPNRVTNDLAVDRIARLAQVDAEEVEILDQSNNNLPFGDLQEVTYEVEIRGKTASATCSSGWMYTSPLVCKLYWGSVPQ